MKYTHAPYWRGLPYSRAIRLSRGTTKLNLKNYTPVHVANRSFVILHPPSTSFTLVSFKLSLRAPKPAFHRINLPLRPIATVFQGVECGFVLFSLFYFSSLFAYFSFFFFFVCSSGKSRLISAFNENVLVTTSASINAFAFGYLGLRSSFTDSKRLNDTTRENWIAVWAILFVWKSNLLRIISQF